MHACAYADLNFHVEEDKSDHDQCKLNIMQMKACIHVFVSPCLHIHKRSMTEFSGQFGYC